LGVNRSTWYPHGIALPRVYNWTQFSVIGLDVAEKENLGGAIFNLVYTANVPFVTSGIGAEDGPLMTIVAIAAICVMAGLIRNKSKLPC